MNENWRGYKADAYEGGHRVPFIVRWPGKVEAGTRSDELVSLVDITATVAEVVGYELPVDAAEDSVSLLPVMLGKSMEKPLHEAVVLPFHQRTFCDPKRKVEDSLLPRFRWLERAARARCPKKEHAAGAIV